MYIFVARIFHLSDRIRIDRHPIRLQPYKCADDAILKGRLLGFGLLSLWIFLGLILALVVSTFLESRSAKF